MTYETVTIALTQQDMDTLRTIAKRELRKPKDQAAYLLRHILQFEDSGNNKTATPCKVFQAEQVGGFVEINP